VNRSERCYYYLILPWCLSILITVVPWEFAVASMGKPEAGKGSIKFRFLLKKNSRPTKVKQSEHFVKKKTISSGLRKPLNPCPTHTQWHHSPCHFDISFLGANWKFCSYMCFEIWYYFVWANQKFYFPLLAKYRSLLQQMYFTVNKGGKYWELTYNHLYLYLNINTKVNRSSSVV